MERPTPWQSKGHRSTAFARFLIFLVESVRCVLLSYIVPQCLSHLLDFLVQANPRRMLSRGVSILLPGVTAVFAGSCNLIHWRIVQCNQWR